jgi:hypothetical protein
MGVNNLFLRVNGNDVVGIIIADKSGQVMGCKTRCTGMSDPR